MHTVPQKKHSKSINFHHIHTAFIYQNLAENQALPKFLDTCMVKWFVYNALRTISGIYKMDKHLQLSEKQKN